MNNAYSEYLKWLKNDKKIPYSENTMKSIEIALNQFFNVFKGDINLFTKDDLLKYKQYLLNHLNRNNTDVYSIATINQRLNHLKKFFQVLHYELNYPIDIYIEGEKIQTQNIIDKMLENEDVTLLLNIAPEFEKQLIYGLFFTGARISELLQIKTSDIANNTIRVKGKGNKYRFLFIPDELKGVWKRYSKIENTNNDMFFCIPSSNKLITRQNVYNKLINIAVKQDIDKQKVHPHAFRHLYARNLSEAGVQTAIIKQLLGHSLSVTEGYLSISREKLIKIVNSFDKLI